MDCRNAVINVESTLFQYCVPAGYTTLQALIIVFDHIIHVFIRGENNFFPTLNDDLQNLNYRYCQCAISLG